MRFSKFETQDEEGQLTTGRVSPWSVTTLSASVLISLTLNCRAKC